jgi:hypothetical protein
VKAGNAAKASETNSAMFNRCTIVDMRLLFLFDLIFPETFALVFVPKLKKTSFEAREDANAMPPEFFYRKGKALPKGS